MVTFTIQTFGNLLLLAAALLSLRVARRPASDPYHHAAWVLVAAGFVLHATLLVGQNAFGLVALLGGARSEAMAAYLRWLPAMNHSRTFLLVGVLLSLGHLSVYRGVPDRRFAWASAVTVAVLLAVGIGVGVREGRFTPDTHYTAVAIWDVMELLSLMGALFALLLSERADRALWLMLAMYGSTLALGTFWFAIMAWIGNPQVWQPPIWSVHAQRIFFHGLMAGAVLWRLRDERTAARPLVELRRKTVFTLR